MWNSLSASFQQALEKTGDALEKTGDVLTNAATNAGKSAREKGRADASTVNDAGSDEVSKTTSGRYAEQQQAQPHQQSTSESVLASFQMGWSSVVESTKAGIQHAQHAMEEQQHRLQERIALQKLQARDPSLPLDVAALQDAGVVYLTDRIITLSHPYAPSNSDGSITAERKLAAVGHLLQKRHAGRYMVWNLSEVDYPVELLENQVLNYSFPGSPSPPLGLLLKLLVSLESWLKADNRNVAVIHCLTGKGRTSTVVASFLCWMKEAGFVDINETLQYIAACKQTPESELTIPSQRRYCGYFKNMLDNVRPSQPPLLIQRVILSHAPKFARGPGRKDANFTEEQRWGCAPYLQLFKGGKLVFTAPASLKYPKEEAEEEQETKQAGDTGESPRDENAPKKKSGMQELPFCHIGDGSVSFHVGQMVQGDVLVRCRHLTARRARISMFRAAFHTGYIGGNVLRLTKQQLDGACHDHDRFQEDFYLDIIFETVTAEQASQVMTQQEKEETGEASSPDKSGGEKGESKETKEEDNTTTTVTASAYDTMLDRDSRFWDVIAKRKKEQDDLEKNEDKAAVDSSNENQSDPLWGPTVGRRRPLDKDAAQNGTKGTGGAEPTAQQSESAVAAPTFSIGGELDFLPQEPAPKPTPKKPSSPKRDSLMEALAGALGNDDEEEDNNEEENEIHEIVFSQESESESTDVAGDIKETTAATTGAPATSTTSVDVAVQDAASKTEVKEVDQSATPEAPATPAPAAATTTTNVAAEADQLLSNLGSLSLDDDDVNALLADDGAGELDDDLADLEDLLTSSSGKK